MSINACYGGTAALFNTLAWMQSASWDGRLGIVLMTDIAVYPAGPARPTGGAGAVALLIAPEAAISMEPLRATFMDDCYDFYKPDMSSEYPTVDGGLTVEAYTQALATCYTLLKSKYSSILKETLGVNSFDQIIFHSPYQKLIYKSFHQLLFMDM
jgi:hydroxymethylglutaryl-CoA synthase